MKKLLKKICMFGISVATTLSFCQPVVKGREPDASDLGVKVGSVNIAKDTTDAPVANIILASNLTYNGNLQQLILSVNSVKLSASSNTILRHVPAGTGEDPSVQQVKVYLRVGDSPTALPASDDWVEYEDTNSLKNAKLERRGATGSADANPLAEGDISDYYVFYYIDGLDNIRDNGAGANGTGDGSVTP